MKVVLFDIDGVLNYESRMRPGVLDRDLVHTFNQLLVEPDVRFVVTSSWRYLLGFEGVQNCLREHGFRGEVIDATDDEGESRSEQIHRWLALHSVESFVVFDDQLLPNVSNFVHVNPKGITTAHVSAGLHLLNPRTSF